MYQRLLKLFFAIAILATSASANAQINGYEVGDKGYLSTPMESASGIVMTNNRYSEIYLLQDNKLKPILTGRNCGLYTNMSKDGKYIGYKSFNEYTEQAPAMVEIATGEVTILDEYIHQCGQVSFSDNGKIAYTMEDYLIVRDGDNRKEYDLGFYTNIANISPDGKYVAYSNIEGGMYVLNLETGAVESLNINEGYQPIWSPDGSKIAIHVGDGTISVLDRASDRLYELGEGRNVSWANNNEIIYTRLDFANEFEVTSSEILKTRFDGSQSMTLVAASECLPSGAILTSDNKLVIPYMTGAKRGLAVKSVAMQNGRPNAAAQETSVITFDEEQLVGARLDNVTKTAKIRETKSSRYQVKQRAIQQKIGPNDIPYLSQIYSVPSISGCTKYGYVACAPTSASMYLGYYGLLNKKATTSRYNGQTDYYAYHVGKSYTNQKGTKTFSEKATGNGCSGIQGGYGYMWYGSRSPRSVFTDYMIHNGCTDSQFSTSRSTSWTRFQNESKAGRPTLLCIALRSSGHLILGFATNCRYRSSGSQKGFTEYTGAFVCHDPYGDCNDSSWADGDGYHSTYDWVGYNNGHENIDVFYYSVIATPPTSSVQPSTPKVSVNKNNLTFEAEYGAATQPYIDVVVKGENLDADLAIASNSSLVSAKTQSGWNARTGGTLRLTLNTNFTLGAGVREGYVAVQSTSSYRVEIKYKATLTDPAGSTTPDPDTPSNPDNPVGDDNLIASKGYFSLIADYGATTQPYVDIVVKGNGLSGDISCARQSSVITLEQLSGWDTKTGGTLRCILNTNFTRGPGVYETGNPEGSKHFVAIQSGTHRIEIPYIVTLNDPNEEIPDGPSGDIVNPEPEPEPEFIDNITALEEMWVYSTNKGNLSEAPWFDVTNYTRDVAVNGDNLYVLSCKQWGTPVITILDAYKGSSKGTMSVEGVSGGRAALGAIDMLGGKLIGVNAVTAHEMVFYKWDSETSAPAKWATTTPGIAMGDQMSVSGDMTNGAIWLVSTPTNQVYKYLVSNGVVNTTPTIITLSKAIGAQNGCASVAVAADGTLWVDGKDVAPMHFKADGTYIEELPATVMGSGQYKGAEAIEIIPFGSKTYMTAITYVDASNTLSNGAIALINMTDGVAGAAQVGIYPSAGFGTTRNTQYLNALTHSLTNNNHTLNVWGVSASQGIAYYRYVGAEESGVEDLFETPAEEMPVEWYNLHGVRVDGENLVPGIYIRRQGNDVSKVLVK